MLCLSRLSILLSKHIHTFLPITFLIFNGFSIRKKFWKAETQGFFNHTSNTIHVDTVNTRQGSLMHSMLPMLTLSIQFSHLIVLCIRCCVRATNNSVDSVDKHSIKCIVCFDLHIDSVDKQDTLLNTQEHCFDLLYRPSQHALMSIQTTMQILIQSLRITVKFNLNP